MDDKWRKTSCSSCYNGMKWSYTYDEPIECSDCAGSGSVYIRPTGHCFMWPGGPALGMWSKEEYKKAIPEMPFDLHVWDASEEEIDSFDLDRHGNFLSSQPVRCICGLQTTIGGHEIHTKEMEKLWIEEHRDNE